MKLIVKSDNNELLDYLNDKNHISDISDVQIIISNNLDNIISNLSNKTIILLDHQPDDFDAIEASSIIDKTIF